MELLNKFIVIAVLLVVANYASGNFVFQQMGKAGEQASPYSGTVTCILGAYMYSPSWNGLPLPALDDVVVGVIIGLLILGVLSLLKKPVTTKQKIGIFIGGWLVYKLVGYYLMISIPGCEAMYNQVESISSPLTPLFLVIAVYAVYKLLNRK